MSYGSPYPSGGERPPDWPPPPFDPPGEPLPYEPLPESSGNETSGDTGSSSEPKPDWWPNDWPWPPEPDEPIEVLYPPPLPNIIWPRLPPDHPYYLPPGYSWPDNLPEGHPGHNYHPGSSAEEQGSTSDGSETTEDSGC